jgi:hypothetical protein
MPKSIPVDWLKTGSKKTNVILIVATHQIMLIADLLAVFLMGAEQDAWIFDASGAEYNHAG